MTDAPSDLEQATMTATILDAIETSVMGQTNKLGARIVARSRDQRFVFPYDYSLSATDNHIAAARTLAVRVGWSGEMVTGGLRGLSMAHVFKA